MTKRKAKTADEVEAEAKAAMERAGRMRRQEATRKIRDTHGAALQRALTAGDLADAADVADDIVGAIKALIAGQQ